VRIEGGRAAVELLGVGMVGRVRQHARDDAALVGHAQAFVGAKLLDAAHETILVERQA